MRIFFALDTDQNLQSFLKKDLKEVIHEHKSLMPTYSDLLRTAVLPDLTAELVSRCGE